MTAEPAGPVLSVRNAVRRYPGRTALDGVSLSIAAGEVYALIGRNGAGKSTLAKAVVGALALDSGSVRVLGADPVRDREARRRIGVAPQDIALWGHLSIQENLEAFAVLAGVAPSNRSQAVDQALAAAGCADRRGERVDALSGGWRRRANLAAAIVHRPRLLVLDEPTEGLDAETRCALRTLVETLRRHATAVLLISHDAEDVATLADRVGVLEAGRLAAEGTPASLMTSAFAGRQELTVRVDAESSATALILTGFGLTPADGGAWSGLAADALAQARSIDEALRAAGVPVGELIVRHPRIDALIAWASSAPQP